MRIKPRKKQIYPEIWGWDYRGEMVIYFLPVTGRMQWISSIGIYDCPLEVRKKARWKSKGNYFIGEIQGEDMKEFIK